jgi:hypothetical protein
MRPALLINHYRRCCKPPRRLRAPPRAGHPRLERLLDMNNQIGDDAGLVKVEMGSRAAERGCAGGRAFAIAALAWNGE